ncbi:RdgB/HAM1 family non-canonical purine NTP pyrophosphatase [Methyloversatilis sp.]|uniref:RdgB/HAM1 family non-canonical purine NTP pyrophosphatase n=1 Tax=Methyloversatilis sp. TaxID=2569862 RepID=UPI0027348495|nr:RdgB/HAM1 family non-canonical purine NTP pyrophosphatase [Methyloversatilis sp.]MDP2869020.1 RdgB/HAM1 family non-canonical purine NTP pyrophosphatase [Methyloversatilis sp.]MDP3457393.1 RdgB/HAM1 family non-canonical purine NTP pyrophosphatase [Methyloversatilis sp.]MDP3577622.1 RdgB/HAM1 family non-canonical purine NTP pyrophosphatase [Methyloversatilis sp.]
MKIEKLVLASGNAGKLRELSAMLAPLGIEVVTQASLGVAETDEPHVTFVENALVKARHAARETGLPALADDSGLCVSALGGRPGVLSARYAGEPKSDVANNAKVVAELHGIEDRRAHFYSVIVLVCDADDPRPLIADGEWHGEIIESPRGDAGFGYDPHFWVPSLEQTAAELAPELKNTLSHRASAMRHLLTRLQALTGG